MAYPIVLELKGRSCLIVGGGSVAVRKAQALLAEGAMVTVVSPQLHPDFAALSITHIQDSYATSYVDEINPLLVFAATDRPEINLQIVEDSQQIGALVNAVDGSGSDDFSNMITLEKYPITIAISTGGVSPVMSQRLRDEMTIMLGEHYPTLAQWFLEIRDQLKHDVPSSARRHEFWRTVMTSDVINLLKQGYTESARSLLDSLYNEAVGESS